MRGPAKLATYLAAMMTLAGFTTIFLAWNFAASIDRVPEQFPYLLSGGMTGIGLIIGGMAVMAIQTARHLSAERAQQMARVTEAMASVNEAVRERGNAPVLDGQSTGVVAGRSSFHEPSCHLVAARDDLALLSRSDAAARGLAPCRICRP